MEHNQNRFAPVVECDSTSGTPTGTFLTSDIPDPATIEPVVFDRQRGDGWTPERQRQFLEELADCGIIQEAAARVGMSPKSAWQLRRRAAGTPFATAWEAALQTGMRRIHSVAFERAIEGVVKRVYYHGEVVGEERVYDNRLLLAMLPKAGQAVNDRLSYEGQQNWPEYLDAVGQGLSRPRPSMRTKSGNHVWLDEAGTWWTDFPLSDHAPDNAAIVQKGKHGEVGYCRTLIDDELAIVEARESRRAAEEQAERARFFSDEK